MLTTWTTWCAGGQHIAVQEARHSIFVRQDGPSGGADVTLLHGWPSSSHDWQPVIPALTAAGVRVTTLDFLGLGASDKPFPHAYFLLEQASIVEAVWAKLGIESTTLVAHDYGVSVAQELLHRDPSRVTSMTWLNGGIFSELHRPTKAQQALHDPGGEILAANFTLEQYGRALREILGRDVSDETLHQMWLAFTAGGGLRVASPLLQYIDDRRTYTDRWTHAIASFPRSQHFIWGPADPISGAHVVPRIRELVPQATVSVLDGPPAVGHYPQLEAPDLVAPLLVSAVTG